MTNIFCALTPLIALGATALSAQTPQCASLSYPAKGHFDLDEGTVELWIVPGFDADDKHNSAATYFNLVLPEQAGHYVLMHVGWGGALAMVGYVFPQQSYVWSEKLKWKAGESHHIAWTWSGRTRSIFIDGKVGKSPPGHGPLQGEGRIDSSQDVVVEGWLRGDMTNARIVIGRGSSRFTLDELRISSIARPVEEIAAQMTSASVADAYTLLLDHCDGVPANGGELTGSFEIVEARFGKGIKLWKDQK